MKRYFYFFIFLSVFLACNSYKDLPSLEFSNDWKVQRIPPSPQLTGGDPKAGLEYMTTGDYIGSGVPLATFKKLPSFKDTILNRSGVNATFPMGIMAFEHANGTMVFTGNCLTCHGGFIEGEYIEGLGGLGQDFSKDRAFLFKLLDAKVKLKFKKDSKEREAFEIFSSIRCKSCF